MRTPRAIRVGAATSRPRLVARLRAGGCVFAEDEADELLAGAPDAAVLEQLVLRRLAGEPLEHLLGRVRFAGLDLVVEPGVFVPRQRTAHLADLAAEHAAAGRERPVVVDLCCGVGAVAAVVAERVPAADLYAADLSPAAVDCARRNLEQRATVFCGDLYAALPRALRGRVDVLAVNAPYVPTHALSLLPHEAREHEPALALDGGPDGLDVHRRVLAEAAGWLSPTGVMLFEVGEDQVEAALGLVAAAALAGEALPGEAGATVVRGAPDDRLGSISHQV